MQKIQNNYKCLAEKGKKSSVIIPPHRSNYSQPFSCFIFPDTPHILRKCMKMGLFMWVYDTSLSSLWTRTEPHQLPSTPPL